MSRTIWTSLRSLLAVVAFGLVVGASAAVGQDKVAPAAQPIPEPMTQEAVRQLLSELDDTQVRALLLERFTKEIDRRAAEQTARDARSAGDIVTEYTRLLGIYLKDAVAKVPSIPSGIAKAWSNFTDQRGGERSLVWFFLTLVACVGLGGAAGLVGYFAATRLEQLFIKPIRATTFAQEIAIVTLTIIARFLPVATFVIGAGLGNLVLNEGAPVDHEVVGRVISAIAWTGIAIALARVALSPTLPEWRLCPVASGASEFLVWRIGIAAAIFNFGLGLAEWLDRFGSPFSETRLAFWVNLAAHILLMATVWQARHGIRSIVAGSAELAEGAQSQFIKWWPWLMMGLVAGNWLLASVLAASVTVPFDLVTPVAVTLGVVTALPVIDHALRAGVRSALAISPYASAASQAVEQATREGILRIARVVVAVALIVGLFWIWDLDLISLAEQGMGDRVANSIANILLIAGLAYGLWELVWIETERQIAAERAALGLGQDDNAQQPAEGEGGGAGARLGTILPLVRVGLWVTIAVIAVLAILGELGINVLPILAGAGVVGLAIGFGAQTLVKDIISGVFFLIDDAFRKGEYIDIGSVKGTVEKISLRSMQLRHHNGPLHTIPFGDIRHVTNFSRDWVIMKLKLRLTYDTDAEKVRKMIKTLGQEMMEDPVLGPLFLQPLKSQGVIEMEESAQIMRVKFMTRPGDQWGLRRVVFARIRELFEKEGIRFASREVVVRVEKPSGEHETSIEDEAALGAAAARARDLADAAASKEAKT